MAYKGNIIKAKDFLGLKSLVNTECKKRKYIGSVEYYAGTAYQYQDVPTDKEKIRAEHKDKLYEPLAAINDYELEKPVDGDLITIDDIVNKLQYLSQFKPLDGQSTTGCSASCTGLCTNGCGNECTSCTGTCSGGCYGKCNDTCAGSCSGQCNNTCSGGCSSSCSGDCAGCTQVCSSDCYGCTSACYSGCGSSCQLDNCSNSCVQGCAWTG